MPPVVAAAGIGAAASIAGGLIQSKAAKGAARTQAEMAQQALAEQRRIYDLEDQKERERYQTERQDIERVRGSRQNAFGGFGGDLATFSRGYAPAYGMSAEQTDALMSGRTAGAGMGAGPRTPPDMGSGRPMDPSMPQMTPSATTEGPQSPGGAFASTVWLQAPTGEEMEVPMAEAPLYIAKGAQLIPGPSAGSQYGMV